MRKMISIRVQQRLNAIKKMEKVETAAKLTKEELKRKDWRKTKEKLGNYALNSYQKHTCLKVLHLDLKITRK